MADFGLRHGRQPRPYGQYPTHDPRDDMSRHSGYGAPSGSHHGGSYDDLGGGIRVLSRGLPPGGWDPRRGAGFGARNGGIDPRYAGIGSGYPNISRGRGGENDVIYIGAGTGHPNTPWGRGGGGGGGRSGGGRSGGWGNGSELGSRGGSPVNDTRYDNTGRQASSGFDPRRRVRTGGPGGPMGAPSMGGGYGYGSYRDRRSGGGKRKIRDRF
ncbi:hypothetical protein MMC13_005142 [Lambiella insularis]|nr:hypothetical protein [Lambiella insularis]